MLRLQLLLLCVSIGSVFAQPGAFVENKGQWPKEVAYQGKGKTSAFYLTKKGYKINLAHPEDIDRLHNERHGIAISKNPSSSTIRFHAYEVAFLYADSNAVYEAEKRLPTYYNYFIGNDRNNWASECFAFQTVVRKNVYPGIDVRYYYDNDHLKYDIVVHPGADISKLALQYTGAENIQQKKGKLLVTTSVATVTEDVPFSYQPSSAGRKAVVCNYQLKGNIVRFNVDDYDRNTTLIIDPAIIFSSFSGSIADNWGFTATPDKLGNFYAGGIVFGYGYPATTGAFQQSYQGGNFDVGIMKFNPNGTQVLYATYIGGKQQREQPHSLVADDAGNLVIVGRTRSADFPVTAANLGPCGKADIFVTILSADGKSLMASRKIGGSENDGLNIAELADIINPATIRRNYGDDARSEVILDHQGNICIAASSQSTDFPLTNAFQHTNNGGAFGQDAVVLRLSPDLTTVLLSSYLGGTGDDAAFVLAALPNGNLYVGGATASSDFPGNKGNTVINNYRGGNSDGFICIINAAHQLENTAFMGTPGHDIVFGLKLDKFGFPYVCGTTTGNWPVINAAYSVPGSKQFIAKLKPDLSAFMYSTIFGSPNSDRPNISPVAFMVDRCENVYVSGWGGIINTMTNYMTGQSTFNMPITPDAYKTEQQTDGSDLYFFVLSKNASGILYGSYFGQTGGYGGEHVDGGTSRFDENGAIYQAICANCGTPPKPSFPITPWSAHTTNPSNNCNVAAVKFQLNFTGVATAIKSSINGKIHTSGCFPLTVKFTDTIAQGSFYIWSFGDGSKKDTTTLPQIQHQFLKEGSYQVTLVSIDSSTCNIADTSHITIVARADKATTAMQVERLEPCSSMKFLFKNLSVPGGFKNFSANSFTWYFGDGNSVVAGPESVTHTYAAAGTYQVQLILTDTNFCNYPDTVFTSITITDLVKADFSAVPEACAPYNATFTNKSLNGQSFIWKISDGTEYFSTNIQHQFAVPGTYRIKLIAIDNGTCNRIDSMEISVAVYEPPKALFNFSPAPPKPNAPINIQNLSTGGENYVWNMGDGISFTTSKKDPFSHIYYNAGNYTACLTAVIKNVCADTFCLPIAARTIRTYDVPNAFTPNGDGKNDEIYVRGFEIKKMEWKIFNRWGAVVFETKDFTKGWDGKWNGQMQPQDVYSYTLDIEFSDGYKERRTGDIHLIR